ncbi:MDR family MFS transporter [Paraburkholderia sp. HP33-1]|uniref:MDR family MFS transporter n=1 Tax=Paraburkholderia sp. HP33-1 TaxID=2883243 RepID=UPI001F1EC1B7|nr:MDR family MFS transporter [Paraburkholderia sp. HP33-1]
MTIPSSALELPAPQRQRVFIGLILAMILAALDQSIVATALPVIAADLDGLSHLTWVVTAFMLTSTVSAPLYGKFSDMYGRKPLFVLSIGIFLLASALCGMAGSMGALIVCRALQGLGAGGLITLSQTVIGSIVSPRDRGRYQGLFTGTFAVCSAVGPVLGGLITEHASWRWNFYINLPVGACSLWLVMRYLPNASKRSSHSIDYAGTALICFGSTVLLLLTNAKAVGLSSHLLIPVLMAVVTIASFALLYVVELRAAEPVIDLRLFRIVPYATCVAASGIMAFAMMGSLVFMPLYYQLVLGQTPAQSGTMILPQVIAMLLTSVLGGRFSVGARRTVIILCVALSLETMGLALLAALAHMGAGATGFLVAVAVLGAGMGIGMPNATVIVQNAVPEQVLGAATASMAFVRSLGAALGVAVSGAIMNFSLNRQLSELTTAVSGDDILGHGLAAISQLPATVRAEVVEAYRVAIAASLVSGGIIMFTGLLLVLSLARRRAELAVLTTDGGESSEQG